MNNNKIYELTQDGVDKLKNELTDLIDNKRPQNLIFLKEAREQGDLSENADYDAARNEQSKIETRIIEIENILKNTKIIRLSNKDIVEIGKVVEVEHLDQGKVAKYYLVGTIEANPMKKKISVDSPLGKALIGHEKGDVLSYKSPTGKTFSIKILDVLNENL
ncbi:transcription elongation factor GreA [Haploplasma modicum]|jgi:transcription elongation factor GreA|uniref:transcription elongation factor GreA n=1 Tax=Haploplasma modicum TaxID=2150 RepID=UPI00047B3994|nr:transcription elongation factor GreA [Haploplasma modicum]MCR1809230.1 transcription elongation factor GreA [Haploplasma modicum]